MNKVNTSIVIVAFIIFKAFHLFANPGEQRPPTDANIYGHVIDANTGEHLPFVNLLIKGSRIGTITDATGHYILTNLPVGKHILIAQSMGYARAEVEFEAIEDRNIEVDIILIPEGVNLDEVVLTASPTASGFRYQPDAVFLGEKLQKRSEPSFGEMLNGQPGVAMRSFGSAPARPVIRGMDGDRILVLENGERMGDISETSADHAISLDPLAASRLEVVRGPASLLYGSSALGGVINLMTTDIPDQWDTGLTGVVSGQGATMNNMGAGFGRLTYGNDTWATTARFAMRQAGDITTPEGKLAGTSMDNFDASAGLGINRENLDGGVSLSLSNQNFEIPDSPDNLNESIEIRAQRISLQGRFGRKLKGAFFDQAQLRFNASQFGQKEVEVERFDTGVTEEAVELEYDQFALSSTITLQHKPRGIFARGALGFNLLAQSVDVIGEDIYTPGEQRVSLATFTFQEVPLSRTLRFQFGARFDYQNSKALPNSSFPSVDKSRNAFNYSGSVGLNYRPFEELEIGGQFARSHRNPQVEELFADGPHLGVGVYERGNVDLKDEIGHGADLFMSIKRSFFELELATFVNDFRNYIIFQPTGSVDDASGYPVFEYIGGEAVIYGGEIALTMDITSQINYTTSLDYVRGQRSVDGQQNQNLPVIPPFRFHNQVEFDFNWGWLGSTLALIAKQNMVAFGEEATDGYSLLGFQAGYRLDFNGRHVLIMKVDNALDTKYRDHLSRIEDRNFAMPGRNFNLSYRWFF